MVLNRSVPASLKIVVSFFIFSGIYSTFEMVISFMHGRLNINLGVLGLFIGHSARRSGVVRAKQ